jgi:hypothetical protein
MDRSRNQEFQQPWREGSPRGIPKSMSHIALLYVNGEQFSRVRLRNVPLPPSFFRQLDGAKPADRVSQHIVRRRSITFIKLSDAYIYALTPGCPSPCVSTKCCFCALVAIHTIDYHSEYGDLLSAFATRRRVGRRETGKQTVDVASFIQ